MTTIKLTQDLVTNGLRCPDGRQKIELCDTDLRGLYVEVRATSPGEGTYYLRYKDASRKTCHQNLGGTTDITLAQARKQAVTLKTANRRAPDPSGEAKPGKPAITFRRFFVDHYLPFVKPRKRSWRRDEELFRLRIQGVFGDSSLNEITRQEVQTFHAGVLSGGLSPASADHHVKLIRQALNLAVEWDMLEKNPAAGVRLFNVDNKVENYPDEAQLGELVGVLRTDENRRVCQIALFLLSTGCRLNEALKATWPQIDRDNRVWRIPASNSKSKKIRSVPLNDSALEVLTQVGTEGRFEHLFVNPLTGGRYTTIHKVWGRIRRKAELPHLRIHDLRHMYASFLVNAGCTLYEVQQILGHSDPKVTQRYAHLTSEALQKAANCASVAIRGAAAGGSSSSGVISPTRVEEEAQACAI